MSTPSTIAAPVSDRPRITPRKKPIRPRDVLFHTVMTTVSILWLAPMVYVLMVSLRPFDDIARHGLGALPRELSLDGYRRALTDGGVPQALWNSVIITFFCVVISLALAAMAAYALSRYDIPFRRTILLLMLAGNLLPQQVLLIPASRISQAMGIYDTLLAPILVQVGFGMGFYTFVLHGFMRSLPTEVFEAAQLDGTGAFGTFWRIVLPLCRPSLAALAALATTWVFNDLLWAMTTLQSQSKFPITAALLNIAGGHTSQWNIIAAASLIAAIPPAIVFFLFQKQFVSGLLVGSNK
ncbi:MAG: carbohydrate ABC transporter permease [Brachybacterium sp.]|nr:carbohydrate ABC transporter permease [Brachybacterium sp.]